MESSTCFIVRRVCKKSAIRIVTCTSSAIATTTPTQFCMHAPIAPIQEQRLPARLKFLRLRGFAAIRFARAFDGGGNRFLLLGSDVFSAFDQFIGAFAKFTRFALRVIFSFIGFLGKKFARFFAGFRREQNSDQGSHAQTNQKIGYFGSNIVRHKYLPVTAVPRLVQLSSSLLLKTR